MPQQQRLYAALTYVAVFLALNWVLFDEVVPTLGTAGTWFYAGAALVLLAAALGEPFYATPAQGIGNALALLLVAATFPVHAGVASGASEDTIRAGKWLLVIYAVAVAITALIAILGKDRGGAVGQMAETASRRVRLLGSGRTTYSLIFICSVYAVYSREPGDAAALLTVWLVVVLLQPVERFLASRKGRDKPQHVGIVAGLRHPGLAELRCSGSVGPGDRLTIAPDIQAFVLDTAPQGAATWALASLDKQATLGAKVSKFTIKEGEPPSFLGPVQPGSTISDIRFRVPGPTKSLREGNLVSVPVRGKRVLYQVVSARVEKESLTGAVEHRYVEAVARKIGAWNEKDSRFVRIPWLPVPGEPVTLEALVDPKFQEDSIGCIPDTQFGIRMDPELMVTHNTAILGILGIGKTYLAFELIRRIVASGCKVLVFDITGEYSAMFRDLFPEAIENKSNEAIADAIAGTHDFQSQHVHLGGNIGAFREAVRQDLKAFVEGELFLKVMHPGSFDVTRQDSKMYQGSAALAPLTMVETTRVFAEELLQHISKKMSSDARVCVVLEEAHSLVPEWNSTTYSGDQQASNAIAKAILQGRKYGLGVILVTQRTANVTKTILNQCNTIFALRTFDATGMDFLRNYIGDAYSDVLSGLEDRTAVVFGRASSCPSPVLVGLNEHHKMMEGFWKAQAISKEPFATKDQAEPTETPT